MIVSLAGAWYCRIGGIPSRATSARTAWATLASWGFVAGRGGPRERRRWRVAALVALIPLAQGCGHSTRRHPTAIVVPSFGQPVTYVVCSFPMPADGCPSPVAQGQVSTVARQVAVLPGTYQVVVTDRNGCPTSGTAIVTARHVAKPTFADNLC